MNTSFFKTSIVLVFSFIFCFFLITSDVYAEPNILFPSTWNDDVTNPSVWYEGKTPEQRAAMVGNNPELFGIANPSAYKLMTNEQRINYMKNPSLNVNQGVKNEAAAGTTVKKAVDAIMNPLDTLANVFIALIKSVGGVFFKLASFILYVSGKIFDGVLEMTVKTSSLYDMVKEPISNSWKIVRDVANIAIVFSLLYLAIRTILNGNGFADTKTLAGVLAAAILINFSLFFTQIAFTTSNFLARSIVEQITFTGGGEATISGNISRMVGTQDIINRLWTANQGGATGFELALSDMQAGVLAGMTILVIAAILFIAALMMLYRFLMFTLLMITSPIGLVSSFIPWFKGTGSAWWGQLKHHVIFLPVFMLTLYIALLFIGTITQNITPAIDFVQFFFYFLLTCGFLLGVLIIPTRVAGGGANMVNNLADWGQKKLRALPKRSVQFGGQAIASGSARATRFGVKRLVTPMLGGKDKAAVEKLQEQARGGGLRGSWARERLRTADALNNRSFDVRNVGGIGKKLGIGAGIESWNATVKRKKEKIDARRQKEEKLFGFDKVSKDNKDEVIEKEADRDVQMGKVVEAEKAYKDARAAYNKEKDATIKATMKTTMETKLAEQKAAQDELEKVELEVGKAKNKGMVEHMELVKKRNERMWNKLSQTQKDAIKEIEKELEKKWKEDGKGKRPKEKKNNNNTNTGGNAGGGNNSGGAGGGSSLPPMPTSPPPSSLPPMPTPPAPTPAPSRPPIPPMPTPPTP